LSDGDREGRGHGVEVKRVTRGSHG
jgi:hypothetical protein